MFFMQYSFIAVGVSVLVPWTHVGKHFVSDLFFFN